MHSLLTALILFAVATISPLNALYDAPLKLQLESNRTKRSAQVKFDAASIITLNLAIESANEIIAESDIFRRVTLNSASYAHFQVVRSTLESTTIANDALKVIEASRQLKKQFGFSAESAVTYLPGYSTSGTTLASTCPIRPACDASNRYRTIDGTCNNLQDVSRGKSRTPFQRILAPQYSDGVWSPRRAVDGSDLPSARLVSAALVADVDRPNSGVTLFTMAFAQFVDHDLTLTPVFGFKNGSEGIECCSASGDFLPASETSPYCLPIRIPEDDPFYGPLNRRCMNFVRSMPGARPDCRFGFAEQNNELTHWLDGSQIYGSTDSVAKKLRAFKGGKMRSRLVNGRESLPLDDTNPNCAAPCLIAGDTRVIEQTLLTVPHILWLREHNRIATQLAGLRADWDDETLYQETRRIVTAELVHIVYNEFLPVVVGASYIDAKGLTSSDRSGFTYSYDANIDPTINNEFGVAAFRMGHSLVQGIVRLFSDVGGRAREDQTFTLSTMFMNPSFILSPGFFDRAARGLTNQAIQDFDSSVTSELTTKLFRGNASFGMDLIALNIQRSRDHGIPGYNSYRQLCGLKRAQVFEDFYPEIDPYMVGIFKQVYRSVDDVDLFVGGVYENPVPDALMGPTFTCIVGDQFARLKKGDRFFYDLGGQPHSFHQDQIAEIRKASLARIICDNNDGSIASMQPDAFHVAAGSNSQVACDSPYIPKVDLFAWRGDAGEVKFS